jgi:threonine/homoserine/homoserine lactone efflux protein
MRIRGPFMPTITTLGLFSGACLALTMTPGPDMLLIASRSVTQGRSAGFASLAGILVGTYCHAMLAAFGLSQLFLAVPLAYDIVRFAGAAYLLYLAWKTLRASPMPTSPAASEARSPIRKIFRQGLLTNLLNPKMALFVLALFPQFVRPQDGGVAFQIMMLATVLNFIGLIVNGVVILTASQLSQRWAGRRYQSRVPQYILGSVFAGLAFRLATASRN